MIAMVAKFLIYLFRIALTSNKIFYFSQVNVIIACHLSKIYLQSEKKESFYLDQNIRFFYFKNIQSFIQKKKKVFLENSCSRISKT